MVAIIQKAIQRGPKRVFRAVRARLLRPFHRLRTRGAPEYVDPTEAELHQIELALRKMGVAVHDYSADERALAEFRNRFAFPSNYHGGIRDGVFDEKLVEHFVAWDALELHSRADRWPYLDIASASSPWAKLLRERELTAFSIDLDPDPMFSGLDFYMKADATAAPFATASIGSASLQCAFEMFSGDSDTRLVEELARILKPRGCALIAPLYMHTHPCFYQSVEYFGLAPIDAGATCYLRSSAWQVAASRKYSALTLLSRVLEPATACGLIPRVHVLRNKKRLGAGIYLHFFLSLEKPNSGDSHDRTG